MNKIWYPFCDFNFTPYTEYYKETKKNFSPVFRSLFMPVFQPIRITATFTHAGPEANGLNGKSLNPAVGFRKHQAGKTNRVTNTF